MATLKFGSVKVLTITGDGEFVPKFGNAESTIVCSDMTWGLNVEVYNGNKGGTAVCKEAASRRKPTSKRASHQTFVYN